MEKIAEASVQEIRIDFIIDCKCRAKVMLKSLCPTAPVVFKVQTSSPHKFLVNPPTGVIPPLATTAVQIILKPQSQLPPTYPRSPSDRFLIKTAVAFNLPATSTEFSNSWFVPNPHCLTQDIKLKVAFVGPALLHHAVSCGDVATVKSILRRQPTVVSNLSGQDADSLYDAARESEQDNGMIDLLREAGLRVAVRDRVGGVELHEAVAANRAEEVASIVRRRHHGSLNCRDKEGRTALHVAASGGYLDCAKVLLDADVDVDARSEDGRTALFRAAANGDRPMVELLMSMHADPTITENDNGLTAIEAARQRGYDDIVKLLGRGEAVFHAARRGQLEQLEALLVKGARVDFCDQHGWTALHVAAIKGNKYAVAMLLEYGAALECQEKGGHTPLHVAVEGGCLATAAVLIRRGADVNAVAKSGATPLQIASVMNRDDISVISRLLIDCGAVQPLHHRQR